MADAVQDANDRTNTVRRLSPVTVTATRVPTPAGRVPYSVRVVRPVDFARELPRTTPEALRGQPSVMLQKTAHGQGSPFVRGFTGFRTLMLVDGIRLNNSTYREGPNQYWNTVDSFALERLELVRGPGSVMYGSDAIGGTAQAFSVGPRTFAAGSDWDGRAYYRHSTAENSHVGRIEAGGHAGEQFGFHLGGTWKEFGDLTGGQEVGAQPRTGHPERDLDARFEYRLSPAARIIVGHQTVNQDNAWRTHATVFGRSWAGTTVGTDLQRVLDQDRHLSYVQLHAEPAGGFADEVHLGLSHHFQGETEDRVRASGVRDDQGFDVHTVGVTLQLRSDTRAGRWVYGAEYYQDRVDSFFHRHSAAGALTAVRQQGPVADDAGYHLAGVFAEDQIALRDGRLELTLGGRYTHAAADAAKVRDPATGASLSLNDSWDSVVGNARVLGHLDAGRRWTLFAGASQGFRAPNLSDLTRFDIARTGEQEVPAFNLRPEQYLSFETGVRTRHERLSVEATLFHTLLDDQIVRVSTGTLTAGGDLIVNKENSGQGHIQGVELAADLTLTDSWSVWGNFTWMEGNLDTPVVAGGPLQREPVSRLMPLTVNAGLRWEPPGANYWFEAVGTHADRQDRLSAGDVRDTQRIPPGGTPGHVVYHLRAGWRPAPRFTLSAALENLFDEDYRIHGSGLNEPGRNFVVAADLRF